MKGSRFRKWLIGGFVAALVGAIVYGLMPRPVPVDFVHVTRGPMRVTVDEEGKTRIKERYAVSAPLAGQLRRIELKAGDAVAAGTTVLAIIEPSDPGLLDARAHTTAQARVRGAEAAKQQAAHHLEKARVGKDFADNELKRVRAAGRASSEQAVHEAEMLSRTKAEDVKAAQFAEQIASFELEQAQAALLQINPAPNGSTDSPRFEIPSPIDGEVLGVLRESAGIVQAGSALVEVGDPRNLEVVVQVLSSDAVKIRPGATATLEQWGGEQPLNGRVRRIEPAAFTKISALGVEEQRVNALIDFTDSPESRTRLGDGFRVEARITIWSKNSAVMVPVGALFRDKEQWAVYCVKNGKAKLTPVEIGRMNAVDAEVLDGLEENDVVVAHAGDKVHDGVAVVQR